MTKVITKINDFIYKQAILNNAYHPQKIGREK